MSPRSSPSTSRRALLGGCAALAGGLAGCNRLESDLPDVTFGGTEVPTGWPHRFHDLGNSNAAAAAPESLTERWTRRVEANLDRPIVVDGTVFTLATNRENDRTRALAFDAESGDDRWAFELADIRRGRIATVVGDTVYIVGERMEDGDEERLYAIEAGDLVGWTFDADRIIAIDATDSTVFVSVRRGSIAVLDADNGEVVSRLHPAGFGRRWLSDLTPVGRPAVRDRTLFAPFARYDPDREDSYFEDRIAAFHADGIAWTYAVDDVRFLDDVTAVDGTVYALTTDRRTVGEDLRSSLIAIEANSGEHRWTRSVDGGLTSVVAVRGELAVVAGREVIAFDARSGEQRWRNDVFSGPPVIAGDRVYGRGTEGSFVDTVVAADFETGERTDTHTFEYQLNRAPIFADGRAIARTLEYDHDDENGTAHVADRLHALW